MKIGPLTQDSTRVDAGKPSGTERPVPVSDASGSSSLSSPSSVDRVSLSGGQRLLGQSSNLPFDARKVEEVRQMIAEGRFPVDAKRVAERLLAESKDMLGLTSSQT